MLSPLQLIQVVLGTFDFRSFLTLFQYYQANKIRLVRWTKYHRLEDEGGFGCEFITAHLKMSFVTSWWWPITYRHKLPKNFNCDGDAEARRALERYATELLQQCHQVPWKVEVVNEKNESLTAVNDMIHIGGYAGLF